MRRQGSLAVVLLVAMLGLPFGAASARDSGVSNGQERVERREPTERLGDEANAHETVPWFSLKVDGTKTWTLTYGLGHPGQLASSAVQPGVLTMDQSLAVDVAGEAFSILRAEARYNDQTPKIVESMALRLEADRLSGVLGDFSFTTVPGFTTYMKTMRGLRLVYRMGDATLTAVASRAQGIPESVVFVGESAKAHVEYRFVETSQERTLPAPYRTNLDGLNAYRLDSLYTEEFSSVSFRLSTQQGLRSVLAAYEMSVLLQALETEPEWELKPADFRVVQSEFEDQVLLLWRDPLILMRNRVRDLITLHNEINELSGEQAMVYPFVVGTEYERGFLEGLYAHALLVVDQEEYRVVDQARERRFYNLGNTDVNPATVAVEVQKAGGRFERVSDVLMPDYRYWVHEELGVLECEFPNDFYASSSAIKVSFSYRTLEGAFILGLSIIPGSERVLLNSERLKQGTDYAIDYETGVLFLIVEFLETDVLQIDYERYAGGFGTASAYARDFYGLSLDLPISATLNVRLNLMQMVDVARATANTEGIATMPNWHTVVGMQADFTIDDLLATVRIGYNHDVFPFDSNDRTPVQNSIHAIAADDEYVFFGHRAGLTVFHGDRWTTYGLASGLSGRIVQAVAVHDGVLYMGTNAGLTTVRLEGTSPFDRAPNWSRLFTKGQIPSASIAALLVHKETLWMGTEDGLVSMSLGETPTWERLAGPDPSGLPKITALQAIGDTIYVGTVRGAYAYDIGASIFHPLVGTEEEVIHDFAVEDGRLYVASNQGLSVFRREEFVRRMVLGVAVYSAEAVNGDLFYGTDDGLHAIGVPVIPLPSGLAVTAVAVSSTGVWVGSRATGDGRMPVWRIAQDLATYPETTTGIPARDDRAFRDSLAAPNTTTGWMSAATFRQDAARYSLTGSIELLQPAFRAIGSAQRSDSAAWSVSGTFSVGDWGRLSIRHEYRMTGDGSGTPSSRMAHGASLTGDGKAGLRWTTSLSAVESRVSFAGLVVPSQEVTAGASIRNTFFGKALQVEARWDLFDVHAERSELSWQRESYGISYTGALSSSLSSSGSWDRNVRRTEDRSSGTDTAKWLWTWKPALTLGEVAWADATAQYEVRMKRALSAPSADWLHKGSLGLTFTHLSLDDWRIEPSVRTEATHEEGRTDLRVEAVSRFVHDQMTLRGSLVAGVTDLGKPVHHQNLDGSVNARYTAIQAVDLSGTYTGSHRVAIMGEAKSPTSTHVVTGRLVWTSDVGLRDDLSVSLRLRELDGERQFTGSIRNDLTLDMTPRVINWLGRDLLAQLEGTPKADLRMRSSGEYRTRGGMPDLSFSQTVDLVLSWPPNGNVSAGATYSGAWKNATGVQSGLLLQAKVAINF